MDAQEWTAFALEVEATFGGDLTPDREAALQKLLGELDAQVAGAALRWLVLRGERWMPWPGDFADALRAVSGQRVVPFAEALPVVLRELQRAKYRANGVGALAGAVATIAERCGEGPARWAQARGFALLMEPIEGEVGGAVRKRLEDEMAAFVSQASEDERTGLALGRAQRHRIGSGGLRRLGAAVDVERSG